MAAVDFARENGLDLAVRGGSHSVPGFGTVDDGVVVDLSAACGRSGWIRSARTARAGGGATWGDFNAATHAFGLATTGGIISTTGVGGLTLGGGIGYLARGLGLSCDNLISADVVTADGRFLIASEKDTRGPVLGAARRRRQLRCGHRAGVPAEPGRTVYGGPMLFEMSDAAGSCWRFFRDLIEDAPEQLGGFPAFQMAPPLPFIPENRHGRAVHADRRLLGRADSSRARRHCSAVPRASRRWSPSTSGRCRTRR